MVNEVPTRGCNGRNLSLSVTVVVDHLNPRCGPIKNLLLRSPKVTLRARRLQCSGTPPVAPHRSREPPQQGLRAAPSTLARISGKRSGHLQRRDHTASPHRRAPGPDPAHRWLIRWPPARRVVDSCVETLVPQRLCALAGRLRGSEHREQLGGDAVPQRVTRVGDFALNDFIPLAGRSTLNRGEPSASGPLLWQCPQGRASR